MVRFHPLNILRQKTEESTVPRKAQYPAQDDSLLHLILFTVTVLLNGL